ncbi:MAG: HK97 gp10 family phage protein [Candidatus Neomicrothrix subdominans]
MIVDPFRAGGPAWQPDGLFGRMASRIADQIVVEAERMTDRTLKVRTDTYRRSFERGPVRTSGRKVTVIVGNTADHAGYIERGTKPHVIEPRRPGGRLRFELDGATIFARRVNHPGTRPYRILGSSARKVLTRVR